MKIIPLIISLGIIASSCSGIITQSSSAAYNYVGDEIDFSKNVERSGVIPEDGSYKNLDFYLGDIGDSNGLNAGTLSVSSSPSYVDLSTSPCFPPIGDQGSLYSCVAFASTYYQYSYEVNKLNGVTSASDRVIYSPKWTYNLSNYGSDNGTSLSYAYTMLKQFGCL